MGKFISRINVEKVELFLLIGIFLIPITPVFVNSWFIIALLIVVLYKVISEKKLNFLFIYFSIPFIIILFSNLFHLNFESKYLDHCIAYLIVPFIFFNLSVKINSKNFHLLFWTFVIGTSLLLLFYLFYFLHFYSIKDLFKQTYNVPLFRSVIYEIPYLNVHPTYLGIWICIILNKFLIDIFKKAKYILIIPSIIFSFFIIILASKIVLFCLLLNLIIILLYFKKYIVLVIGTLVLTFILVIFNGSDLLSRYKEIYIEYTNNQLGDEQTSASARYVIFNCAKDLVKENWLVGIGENKIKSSLDECYQNNMSDDYYKVDSIGPHNYYFYILLNGGILALLFFLFYLSKLFQISIKFKNLNLFLFLTTICLVNLTEDFLYRHHGIVFYNIFLMLFLLRNIQTDLSFNFLALNMNKQIKKNISGGK